MVQILEDQPSFASQFMKSNMNTGTAFAKAFLGQRQQSKEMQQENEALKGMGIDLTGVKNPEIRKSIITETLKGQNKQKQDKKDLGATFGSILNEMKELKEHVGPLNLGALNPYSETSGKRSQINNLRLSLEGLFRDLTLKGQFPKAIYERILKELPQASDTEQQYLNKIEGIEKIINAQMMGKESDKKAPGKMKFDAKNPEHKAKAEQLHKTYKDKEKVREILKQEFEGL